MYSTIDGLVSSFSLCAFHENDATT
jgi:hypothetical protein